MSQIVILSPPVYMIKFCRPRVGIRSCDNQQAPVCHQQAYVWSQSDTQSPCWLAGCHWPHQKLTFTNVYMAWHYSSCVMSVCSSQSSTTSTLLQLDSYIHPPSRFGAHSFTSTLASYTKMHTCTLCLKKTVQNCFCQNFVKFPPILIIFGRKMAKRLKLCHLHSFSTCLLYTSPSPRD